METGLIVRYGRLVPGREKEAVDLFAEATQFFGKMLAEEKLTYFEPFFFTTGDYEHETGFFIIKGPEVEIDKLFVDEAFRFLMLKAGFLVEHVKMDLLMVGEGIGFQLDWYNKVLEGYAALV